MVLSIVWPSALMGNSWLQALKTVLFVGHQLLRPEPVGRGERQDEGEEGHEAGDGREDAEELQRSAQLCPLGVLQRHSAAERAQREDGRRVLLLLQAGEAAAARAAETAAAAAPWLLLLLSQLLLLSWRLQQLLWLLVTLLRIDRV